MATKVEADRRILIIQGWIIEGVHDNLILKQIKEQWGLKIRMAHHYLARAHKNWLQDQKRTVEERRQTKIAYLENVVRKMEEKYKSTPDGVRAIASVQNIIIKLDSLIPPKVVKVIGDLNNPLEVNQQVIVYQLPDNKRE
jgi:hypothetical protein